MKYDIIFVIMLSVLLYEEIYRFFKRAGGECGCIELLIGILNELRPVTCFSVIGSFEHTIRVQGSKYLLGGLMKALYRYRSRNVIAVDSNHPALPCMEILKRL